MGSTAWIGKKSEVANPDEALGQDVEEKAPQELRRQERHFPLLAPVGVIFPPEGHTLAVKREQPVIANRNSMRVSSQVTEDLGGTAQSRLGINDPVLSM